MQLVEQGKLDLDRDVNEYLDFAIPKPIPSRSRCDDCSHTPRVRGNIEEFIRGARERHEAAADISGQSNAAAHFPDRQSCLVFQITDSPLPDTLSSE